jgi:hypothetical protein
MIAGPAPIASCPGEEQHHPFEKVKFPNRKMIRSTPGARHKLKIKHQTGDVQYPGYGFFEQNGGLFSGEIG